LLCGFDRWTSQATPQPIDNSILEPEVDMKTEYDVRQKAVLLAIALTTSTLVLGLNAWNQTEVIVGKPVPVVAITDSQVKSAVAGAGENTMQAARTGVASAGKMTDAAGETIVAAYQATGDRLVRSVDQGIHTHEGSAYAAQTAMNASSSGTGPSVETMNAAFNQSLTMEHE
jgi:hypothetical protein